MYQSQGKCQCIYSKVLISVIPQPLGPFGVSCCVLLINEYLILVDSVLNPPLWKIINFPVYVHPMSWISFPTLLWRQKHLLNIHRSLVWTSFLPNTFYTLMPLKTEFSSISLLFVHFINWLQLQFVHHMFLLTFLLYLNVNVSFLFLCSDLLLNRMLLWPE